MVLDGADAQAPYFLHIRNAIQHTIAGTLLDLDLQDRRYSTDQAVLAYLAAALKVVIWVSGMIFWTCCLAVLYSKEQAASLIVTATARDKGLPNISERVGHLQISWCLFISSADCVIR